jgi:hypothetical protein
MIQSKRSLVVLAGVAVLAATSQATITFSNYGSDLSVDSSAINQINATPPQLENFVSGTGTVTDMDSFIINSTMGLNEMDVNEVDGTALEGQVSLTVNLYNGTTVGSGLLETLYSGTGTSAANSGITTALLPLDWYNTLSPIVTGPHLVTYTAQFTGYDANAVGYLGGFAVDAYEAVPEPSAYAALGIGVLGLVTRKRRSGK